MIPASTHWKWWNFTHLPTVCLGRRLRWRVMRALIDHYDRPGKGQRGERLENGRGGVVHKSVTNVLQEPLGRNFAASALLHRLFIDPAADRRELQPLIPDVAVERNLVAPRAPLAFAGCKIGEIRLVAASAAIREFRAVAAKTGLRIWRRDPLHLLDGAPDKRRR